MDLHVVTITIVLEEIVQGKSVISVTNKEWWHCSTTITCGSYLYNTVTPVYSSGMFGETVKLHHSSANINSSSAASIMSGVDSERRHFNSTLECSISSERVPINRRREQHSKTCEVRTLTAISNSPHPFSITSYGGTVMSRIGGSKLECNVNDTYTTKHQAVILKRLSLMIQKICCVTNAI